MQIAWDKPLEVAKGGGLKGEWRQNESNFDYVDDGSVVFDDAGGLAVVWVDNRAKDVFFQRFGADGKARSAPVDVSRTPKVFSWLPRVIVSGSDVFVLWQEIVFSGGSHGGDAFFARSQDGGATFGAPVNLSKSVGGDGKGRVTRDRWQNGSLDLARAADDTLYATWTEYDGPLWFARSMDGGKEFTKPTRIADQARAPALATAGRSVYLAWSVPEDRSADIHVAVSTDGGTKFGPAAIVAHSRAYSDAPKLAIDRSGQLHLAYAEDTRIHYARSKDGRTFSKPMTVSASTDASFPMLAVGERDLCISWEVAAKPRELSRGLEIACSRDGGKTFSAAAAIDGSADPGGGFNGSHQGRLMNKLAIGPGGALAVANSALKHGSHSRIWLLRGRLPIRR